MPLDKAELDKARAARAALDTQRRYTNARLDNVGDELGSEHPTCHAARAIVSAIRELALDGRLYTIEQDSH